jgi:hypothetical protein
MAPPSQELEPPANPGRFSQDYSRDPKFTEAVAKKVYFSPVYFRRQSQAYVTLALAGTRRDAGVSVAEVSLRILWDVVSQTKVGEAGVAYIVDEKGRLIGHPDYNLVVQNCSSEHHCHTDMSKLAHVRDALGGKSKLVIREGEDLNGRKVLTAYVQIHQPRWFLFVELPIEEIER